MQVDCQDLLSTSFFYNLKKICIHHGLIFSEFMQLDDGITGLIKLDDNLHQVSGCVDKVDQHPSKT